MDAHDHIIEKIDKRPCGCTFTDYANGRKVFAPCVPCGLGRAGYLLAIAGQSWFRRGRNLREAGYVLAAVAKTITDAALVKASIGKAVDDVLKNAPHEETEE